MILLFKKIRNRHLMALVGRVVQVLSLASQLPGAGTNGFFGSEHVSELVSTGCRFCIQKQPFGKSWDLRLQKHFGFAVFLPLIFPPFLHVK